MKDLIELGAIEVAGAYRAAGIGRELLAASV